jgi:ABC-2 type transport system permease protein
MTTASAPAAPVLTTPAGPPALGFGGLLRAEWTKIRSVRSTLWSLFAFVVVAVGFSVLIAAVISHDWNAAGNHPNHVKLLTDPTAVIYGAGFGLGQLAICVLGVMVITTEYTTGAIRASLLAVPKRIPMLAAKAVVWVVVDLVVSAVTVFVVFFLSTSILRTSTSRSASRASCGRPSAGSCISSSSACSRSRSAA